MNIFDTRSVADNDTRSPADNDTRAGNEPFPESRMASNENPNFAQESVSNTAKFPQKPGISPQILRDHVINTIPALFVAPGKRETFSHCGMVEGLPSSLAADLKPILENLAYSTPETSEPLSRLSQFQLYVAAHWATCATFVPTDVDNQIRMKLWEATPDLDTLRAMNDFVQEVRTWPETSFSQNALSVRWVKSSSAFLSGHQGEWLSIAAAAYGALRVKDPVRAATMSDLISDLLLDHARVFQELRKARDGIRALQATALIAHNLGDLKRVLEMWHVPQEDALWARAETTTFAQVETLYKKYMADENPRHFALRKPRALRRSHRFLVGLGPFFQEWGELLAREMRSPQTLIQAQDLGDIVEALVDGWIFIKNAKRLNPQQNPQAYARALAGIFETAPGGTNAVLALVPARIGKILKSGELRTEISIGHARFFEKWNHFGLSPV